MSWPLIVFLGDSVRNCVVLGSNSFSGSWFVQRATFAGWRVLGISRSAEPDAIFTPYRASVNADNWTFLQLDLNNNLADICSAIKDMRPSVVVDFAGQSMVAESWANPDQWYQTNVVSKVRLHDFLRTCDWLERYIKISTPEIFGSSTQLINESQPFNPTTPYAVSQAAIDMSLGAYHRNYGFPVSWARFANYFGPHQQLYRIVPRAIIYARLGMQLPLHGGGTSVRAFIHGSDVADALMAVIDGGKVGEAYHFTTKEFVSVREVVSLIAARTDVAFDQLVHETIDRPGKDMFYLMSGEKAERELQWKPKIALSRGIDETVRWVDRNLTTIRNLPLDYVHKP